MTQQAWETYRGNPDFPLANIMQVGRWLPAGGSYSARSLTLNRLTFVTHYIPRVMSFDRIGVSVAVAGLAGAVARLGLYADDGTGQPGLLIGDYGTVAIDAVANPSIAINQQVPPGILWAGCAVQSDASGTLNGPSASPFPVIRSDGGGYSMGWFLNGVAGALPADARPLSGNTAQATPGVFLRISA